MRVRALGYVGGLALVPALWWLDGRKGPFPMTADLAVSIPLLIDAAGNSLGIYDSAHLDDVVHFFNTAALSSLVGAAVSDHVDSRATAAGVAVAFGIFGELAWEAMEYAAEAVGFDGLDLSAVDTIGDILSASAGAVVAGIVTWKRWRPGRGRLSAPFR
ncbi:hypothetical protein BH20CHL6_BH20CHL6_03350 [soil metagenome]